MLSYKTVMLLGGWGADLSVFGVKIGCFANYDGCNKEAGKQPAHWRQLAYLNGFSVRVD